MLYKNTRKKQDMWLKPGFKNYDRPLVNGARKKIHLFLLIQETVLRTAKTLRVSLWRLKGQGWVDRHSLLKKIIEWKKFRTC